MRDRRAMAHVAVSFLLLVLWTAALTTLQGCVKPQVSATSGSSPAPARTMPPTAQQNIVKSVALRWYNARAPSATIVIPDPVPIECPNAATSGWRAYWVVATSNGTTLPLVALRYQEGRWSELPAKAPCVACHDPDLPTEPAR